MCRYPLGSGGNLVIGALCLPDDKSFFTISLMKSSRFKLLLLSGIAIKNSLLHRATLNPDRFHILIASSFDRTRFIL